MSINKPISNAALVGADSRFGALLLSRMAALLHRYQFTEKIAADDICLFALGYDLKQMRRTSMALKPELIRLAERRILSLRQHYAGVSGLSENAEIIRQFADEAASMVFFGLHPGIVNQTQLLIIANDPDNQTKEAVLKELLGFLPSESLILQQVSAEDQGMTHSIFGTRPLVNFILAGKAGKESLQSLNPELLSEPWKSLSEQIFKSLNA